MESLLHHATSKLSPVHGQGEARAMARRILEEGMGLGQIEIFSSSIEDLAPSLRIYLDKTLERIIQGEPLQYVLGFEYFCSLRMEVGPGVLIPRPETEDLVGLVCSRYASRPKPLVLDACTGSGAIAIAISKMLDTHVDAVDISLDALFWAERNVASNSADVRIIQADIRDFSSEPVYDILVSNPPYVLEREKSDMDANVLEREPSLALFVPDDDPLCFYRTLAGLSHSCLKPGGEIFMETNTAFSESVADLFVDSGFVEAEVLKDRFGMDRMVHALKPLSKD